MNIINLFPVALGRSEFNNYSNVNKLLIKHCLDIKNKIKKGGSNWQSDVFNTCGVYDIFKDTNFKLINDWVFENVLNYSKNIGYDETVKDKDGWFNIYGKHDYQETHNHIGHSDISAIYYLKVPKNSGQTSFLTYEIAGIKDVFKEENPYTWKRYYINPQPGQLVIFKSNLLHNVSQNKSKDCKISLAYNFKF